MNKSKRQFMQLSNSFMVLCSWTIPFVSRNHRFNETKTCVVNSETVPSPSVLPRCSAGRAHRFTSRNESRHQKVKTRIGERRGGKVSVTNDDVTMYVASLIAVPVHRHLRPWIGSLNLDTFVSSFTGRLSALPLRLPAYIKRDPRFRPNQA